MHCKNGTPAVALVLFSALSAVSFAQTGSRGGVNPTAEGIWRYQFNTQSSSVIDWPHWNGEGKGNRKRNGY